MKIKICGFTVRNDIECAISLGIRIVGINLYDKSPRHVSFERARELLGGLPSGVMSIGVFVNPDEGTLLSSMEILNLSGVQLHGDEPPELIRKIRKEFPDRIIIKALKVGNSASLQNGLKNYRPDYFLLDAYRKDIPGGTGRCIEKAFLREAGIPWEKIFLAGGITPENVRETVEEFKPYGIDVASGVESTPGRKDSKKMRRLVYNVK